MLFTAYKHTDKGNFGLSAFVHIYKHKPSAPFKGICPMKLCGWLYAFFNNGRYLRC